MRSSFGLHFFSVRAEYRDLLVITRKYLYLIRMRENTE